MEDQDEKEYKLGNFSKLIYHCVFGKSFTVCDIKLKLAGLKQHSSILSHLLLMGAAA